MSSVLIVENNDFFRKSLSEILRMHLPHVAVEETSNCHDALEKVDAHHPDVVFMDIRLPGGNGLELAREIKGNHPDVTVSIFTNYDLPEYRSIALQYGADHFLLKDTLSGAEIASLVNAVISRKQQNRCACAS